MSHVKNGFFKFHSFHSLNFVYMLLVCYTVAPNITTPMEGQEFTITEGSNGSIICTATGYPAPTVVWQNSDGSSLSSNNRLVSGDPVISSTGVGNVTSVSVELMVIGAMRVDTGMYRCSANNSVSSTTRNIIITVQCKLQFYNYTYVHTQLSINNQSGFMCIYPCTFISIEIAHNLNLMCFT